ncbi:MAG: radical SAM protein [Elusimicrobiota bacterium]
MKEALRLVAPGCLGTCWYGKYHYVEPWVGCGHGCDYCYARSRSVVTEQLAQARTSFEKPAAIVPQEKLLETLKAEVREHKVETAKLCRFTDIFSPPWVEQGLSLAVLETLVETGVGRIIITTKGLPDKKILAFLRKDPARFSYNAAVRPCQDLPLESGLPLLEKRLEAAAVLAKAGLKVTIHLDPMVPGFDDAPAILEPFFGVLKGLGLSRVMFSYLLLNKGSIDRLEARLGPEVSLAVLKNYDLTRSEPMLPGQEETDYFQVLAEVKQASVRNVAGLLKAGGFDFVLCSLKSVSTGDADKLGGCAVCDGSFYA